MQRHQSYVEYYTSGPYAQYVVETRSAGSAPITMVKASQPEGDFSDPPVAELTLVHIDKHAKMTTRDYGAGTVRTGYQNGDFDLIPAGTATSIYCEGHQSFTTFALPQDSLKAALSRVDPEHNGDFGKLHSRPFRSLELSRLCRQIWREARAGNPMGSLYADALTMLIAAELYGLSGGRAQTDEVRLSASQLKRVEDIIDTLIADDLKLEQLSSEVRMDATTFLKAFRASTGLSVTRYVLEQRIDRARRLLTETNAPIAEIAYDCGFSSQQHMTNMFSAKLGISPGRLRKETRQH